MNARSTNPIALLLVSLCVSVGACADRSPELEPSHALAEAQQAVSSGHYGWVLVPNPYDPVSTYNGAGGDVRIDGFEPGRYSVRFGGLGVPAGNVQVTAYGDDDARCKIGRVSRSADGELDVYVLCHAADGTPVRSRFAVGFAEGADLGAHLVADQPTRGLYVAEPGASYNAAGRANVVVRAGRGRYRVMLPGLGTDAAERGHVLVTAYGEGPEHCKVVRWRRLGGAVAASVACFDVHGDPADSGFSLSYGEGDLPAPSGAGAYALADRPSERAYAPHPQTEHTSLVGSPGEPAEAFAARAGIEDDGTHYLAFPGHARGGDAAPSSAFVTAFGEGASYCKLASVAGDEAGVTLRTRCFEATGSPVAAPYVARFVSADAR